jgi:hypothetical protein
MVMLGVMKTDLFDILAKKSIPTLFAQIVCLLFHA